MDIKIVVEVKGDGEVVVYCNREADLTVINFAEEDRQFLNEGSTRSPEEHAKILYGMDKKLNRATAGLKEL